MRNGLSTTTALITRREAAELSGATLGAVNKAIEQRVLRVRRRRGRVFLLPEEAGVLTLLSQTRVSLPVAAKRRVADWVRSRPRAHAELQLDSALLVRMLPETEKTIEHTQRYVELRDRLVEIDPQVRGGEPVIKGTRVPIRGLARQIELGETLDVLREDYPFLPDEAFELAPVWARANPRQGRPARPWTSGGRNSARKPTVHARVA